jgi:hypothetical protein
MRAPVNELPGWTAERRSVTFFCTIDPKGALPDFHVAMKISFVAGAGHDMFTGPNCHVCSDTAFSAIVKTMTFDLL